MKRILYLLLVSAPIFSMQQDTKQEITKDIRGNGKMAAIPAVLYSASNASIATIATAPGIITTSCFPTIGISPVVFGTVFVASVLYNKFNEKYEIRERSNSTQ